MDRIDIRGLRRKQILDAAERLVGRLGWEQTTFAELCREAGVSNGVLTRHFENKDDILLALWERIRSKWQKRLRQALTEHRPGADLATTVVDSVLLPENKDRALYYQLLLQYMSRAPYHPEMAMRLRAAWDELICVLSAKLETSEDLKCDPFSAASILAASIVGAGLGRTVLGIGDRAPGFVHEMAFMIAAHIRGNSSTSGKSSINMVRDVPKARVGRHS